ncbi:MAG: hypothetical protein LBQ30_03050 [Treponema sp.]|jgi:hypothetical protein|nr:hypothetical protein [Treponema sp.]
MNDQELRAKALEIAARILGPTDKPPYPHITDMVSTKGDKHLNATVSAIPLEEMFTFYHELANLVEQDIRGAWKPKT